MKMVYAKPSQKVPQSVDCITLIHRAFSSSFLAFCITAFFTFRCSPCRSFKILTFPLASGDLFDRGGKVRSFFISFSQTSNRGLTGSGTIWTRTMYWSAVGIAGGWSGRLLTKKMTPAESRPASTESTPIRAADTEARQSLTHSRS